MKLRRIVESTSDTPRRVLSTAEIPAQSEPARTPPASTTGINSGAGASGRTRVASAVAARAPT